MLSALLRVALSFAAGHSADVTRTSANHYQVGTLDVDTRDCTLTASERDGERARLVFVGSRAFLRFRDDSGEADGECQVASVRAGSSSGMAVATR
jgi:anti-sigma-K factor RskA